MSHTPQRRSTRRPDSPASPSHLLSEGFTPASTPGFSAPVAPFVAQVSRSNSVHSFYSDSPYGVGNRQSALIEKYSLGPDPSRWGANLSLDYHEDDDDLHASGKASKGKIEHDGGVFSFRGLANLGCVFILIIGLLALFAGYPIIYRLTRHKMSTNGAFNVGGTNATGQVPVMPGSFYLIDPETPKSAHSMPSWNGREDMELVFSDEFNTDGRSFYPGDDPFWEAVDLWYWQTVNLEWYDPGQVTTAGGSLVISLDKKPNHDGRKYLGGMIQSWNKFCFTGGYIEARVMLPGLNNIRGLWPAVWTMGNLGRAGFGATTHGLWPYTYDECDVGTLKNQSLGGEPKIDLKDGDQYAEGLFSFQVGQRLSACTCEGDADQHPGPRRKNDSKGRKFVGRSAPEIDIFEAQISEYVDAVSGAKHLYGEVSQSAQWAPFNPGYKWDNSSGNVFVHDTTISRANSYQGGTFQEATSIITKTDQLCYEMTAQCYSIYGFEYKPGFDDAYITWVSNNVASWTVNAAAMGPNSVSQVGARPVSQEPMYIIMNLGTSQSFGAFDEDTVPWPVHMYVDYVRVYQPKGKKNIGCDPDDFPTSKYIKKYEGAYTNAELIEWTESGSGYNQTWPRNSLVDQC